MAAYDAAMETIDDGLSWVAGCEAARADQLNPSTAYKAMPAACFLRAGIAADSAFLKHMGPLMYITTPDYIATMLYYFQQLSALAKSRTLTPGSVPIANTGGATIDGAIISHTLQEWVYGCSQF
jgi:hypothetical protein